MALKKWIINNVNKEIAKSMAELYDIPSFLALLLQTRGITEKEDIESFLYPENLEFDPMSIADMDKAVLRIERAIDNGENITIYGDYDADGVTATAILYSYLLTRTDLVSYYIPDRNKEGYGLNRKSVELLKERNTELIVTVDNGISAVDEISYANSLGMDTVITDHHIAGEILPPACAVVDPHRRDCPSEFKDFAGVGVAAMLICALEGEGSMDFILNTYSDIACIGTVADVVPLKGMNRAIVCRGIESIKRSERVGINAMLTVAGINAENIQAGNIAFGIAPRINAAGRLSHSGKSVELFLSEDEGEALDYAAKIDDENKKRQQIETELCKDIKEYLKNNPDIINDRVIVIDGEDWHGGVIGIAAARIVDKFGKPCVLITHNGETAKGSGRSIKGFSLYNAAEACSDVLLGFGGHELAAGVTLKIEDIPKFRRLINEYAARKYPIMPTPVLELTCKINPAAVSVDLVNQIKMLEPFGAENITPVFGLFGMKIEAVVPIGGGKHLKLRLSKNSSAIDALVFGTTIDEFEFKTGETADFAVNFEINSFRGIQSVSTIVRDIRPAGFDEDGAIKGNHLFECFKRDEISADILNALLPERQHLAAVYRFFRDNGGWNGPAEYLLSKIKNVPYAKTLACIAVLADKELLDTDLTDGRLLLNLCNVNGKADLESSAVLKKLRGGTDMSNSNYNSYEDLLYLMSKSGKGFDLEIIEKAYKYALKAHGSQVRKSNEPYIVHPVSVACILVELGMDTDSVVAALLHDVVEDTPITLEDIEREFGDEIKLIIDGLTKINKVSYHSKEERKAETIRKILIAMSENIRVIIIKLADRLNNMRTLDALEPQKQRDIALETMEVFAPIAHRLGIRPVKEELEDLALRYLDPVAYKEIEDALDERKVDKENFINNIKSQIEKQIENNIKNYKIDGRVKSISGIYNKMFKLNKTFDEIYDIYAVRVLVESIEECYLVLGEIHHMFIPVPNRFKDYINIPKPNGYQSLHTTVISKDSSRSVFEVQIRTFDMHKMAEYGIAAHWKYKVGGTVNDGTMDDKLVWVRQLLENLKESGDVTEIFQQIKSDIMPEEVYVFTPKGDCKVLPLGSTVIDFAYAVHTEVGHRMQGAKINGNIVPITQQLNTGDFVEIMTTKDSTRGPSRDWLNIVKTSEARTKIRSWFKRERREENIAEGSFNLMREIKRNALGVGEDDIKEIISELSHKMSFDTLEDFYAAIGYGGISVTRIMPRIREAAQKHHSAQKAEIPAETTDKIKSKAPGNKAGEGVIVNGLNNVLVKFSKCCNPLPGDKIIGFVTRGFGVSIHKRDCVNVPEDISKSSEPGRWVEAVWSSKSLDTEYKTSIIIYSEDRHGLLADITMQLAGMKIGIHSFNSRETKDGHAYITATFSTKGIDHIDQIISKLKRIDGIISIERANG